MIDLNCTNHATVRMSQRNLTSRSVEIAVRIGTEVEGGYLVREKDFQAYERDLKQHLAEARRLVGKRIVIEGNRVITAYHADNAKQRHLLRQANDRIQNE